MQQAGVYYCSRHDGIANEDERRCDFGRDPHPFGPEGEDEFDEDGEPRPCVLHPCYYDPEETA